MSRGLFEFVLFDWPIVISRDRYTRRTTEDHETYRGELYFGGEEGGALFSIARRKAPPLSYPLE